MTKEARDSVFVRLGSPKAATTIQKTITQDHSFRAGAGKGAHYCPVPALRRKARGAASASSAWQSLLGTCPATNTVEEGVGLLFLHRPQLTHQCITFRIKNSSQDLQQALDTLLSKGAIEKVLKESSLVFYRWLFLVLKKTGEQRPIIDLSMLNRHMVVPYFKMETQGSVKAAIGSQVRTVSIDIRDAYLHVLMHRSVRKYLRFVVNKRTNQFTCQSY